MRIIYLKLENVAGLIVGSDRDYLEIDFRNSQNVITSIIGENGTGKSVLLSSLSPFASVTSLDERSSLPFIISGKNGYKEVHYLRDKDTYVIKHYYKWNKDSHSVKSYFQLNGIELNENGNVTSFLSLVEFHFGLTQEMMRLIRLGTNVSSFISLKPAERKNYIGKLIEEIDLYLKIYKKINEDLRTIKVLVSSNSTNLYNCHISDLVVEKEKLRKLEKEIRNREKERDIVVSKISKIQTLEKENNINELRRQRQEAEASLSDFKRTEENILSSSLLNVKIDTLINDRSELLNDKVNTQSKINSYRISIDSTLKNIERLESLIKKITSDNDIQSLLSSIDSLRNMIQDTPDIVRKLHILDCSSDDVYHIIMKLSSFNQISQMILTFGNRSVDVYLKLKKENKSVDKFLKDQMKRNFSRVSETDLQRLFDQVFKDDIIITPNCEYQFRECPYYRLSELMTEIREKFEEDNYDDETLNYIQTISRNVDNILNEVDALFTISIPDHLKSILKENNILSRLGSKLPFFDTSELYEYLSILKENELYRQNLDRLKQYEHQVSIYKSSGIDSQLAEIKQLKENIEFYYSNISSLEKELQNITIKLEDIDSKISLLAKYNDSKKYHAIVESTLNSVNKILIPLETSTNEKTELNYQLNHLNDMIDHSREESKILENRINEYIKLTEESDKLNKKYKDLSMILESVSTRKGIPVLYMQTYLGKIQKLANNLLSLVYDDELHLSKFKVTQETFEVPYSKNGNKIPDVKYASQSEIALITMALSFALAHKASTNYNIILLDEIDAGLDSRKRSAFLEMLYHQMKELKAEQCFIISHNMATMINIPMDVIKLSDTETILKLQNVIYD